MGFSVFYAMGLINPKTFTKCIANSAIAPIVKFGVAFPLIYHWMGGMRHLVSTRCAPFLLRSLQLNHDPVLPFVLCPLFFLC